MDILKNNDGHNKPTKNKYKEAHLTWDTIIRRVYEECQI